MTCSTEPLGITVLGSGSRGNAMLIHSGDAGILIDAGFSLKELRRRLRAAELPESIVRGIIVSHEHNDHVSGLRVCANHFQVPVFMTRKCADVMRHRDADLGQLSLFAPGGAFSVSSFEIEPFSVSHDANDPVAFVVRRGHCKIGVATDLGHAGSTVEYQLRHCNTIVLESNHDLNLLAASKRPWPLKQRIMGRHGHLSNAACAELLQRVVDSCTKNIILAHISQECNRPDIAEETARRSLAQIARPDIELTIAGQDNPSATVWNSF
ncbi:MAG TPA: MBL fold metallo-hydrolase [Lentisphaeria bacterium]|nr:MBL fold metallo-hydrolase [Lentisphaerota bacterium]OQC17344.1 MAG: putative metallo-hydrolase YycJ [Lentisphaerae bacterium ADurb.Bin082]HPY90798.1 MBL fold metallo-hydrolase [Lentisphaeria bacterium]HQC51492.1 MBL fold metallo-hydrolase [Lentisphaeria bacterium]HQL86134.1 MBL fold metallo-hydrolase [Lentisphaeria bacterium]